MKIGVDATPFREKMSGIGNYVYYLLEALVLKRAADHFYLYAIKKSDALEAFRRHSNVTIRIVPFLGISEALWSQTSLAWHCRKDKINLFWGTTQSIPLFGRGKTVITIYDFAYRLYPKTVSFVRGAYLRVIGKWVYKKADCLITISQGTATRLDKLYGLKADQVIIPPIKNLLAEPVEEVLKRFSLKYRDYYLMVGTLEPRKNIVPILRAFDSSHPLAHISHRLSDNSHTLSPHLVPQQGGAVLHEHCPHPAVGQSAVTGERFVQRPGEKCGLVVVGGKGWRDSEILQELKASSKNIMTLDYLPDTTLNALVKGAKAFIMPSLYEGYGMPIAEARMLGTPVICCNVPEMVEAAEGDALVIAHDQLELAFSSPLMPPKKPTYPSNEELATLLSAAFSKLQAR